MPKPDVPISPHAPAWRIALARRLESDWFQNAIIGVIIFNALILALETSATAMAMAGPLLLALDTLCLAIFVVELSAKFVAYGPRMFRSGWNVFDAVIVGIGLMPTTEGLTALRALRILRVLRLVSVLPQMRNVVMSLLRAIPGMGSIVLLLSLVYFVAAVVATKLFGGSFPDWFGTIGRSLYSLFQIMTLESWSMGIVRPVMETYPFAWAFFVPFIIITTFAVLNLFIAVMVESMQSHHAAEAEAAREEEAAKTRVETPIENMETAVTLEELRGLRAELAALRAALPAAGITPGGGRQNTPSPPGST